jgi:hypothetical protein
MTAFRPGDVVEIRTERGLAYVQVTHDHPSYPEVVRALMGLHRHRPADIERLVAMDTLFVSILPLGDMVRRGAVEGELIGNTAVPGKYAVFPTFKTPIRDKTGGIAYWWYWDGESLNYEAQPREATNRMPTREVMSASTFLKRLAQANKCEEAPT